MTAVQLTIHPTISKTEKSLWDEAVGPTTRDKNRNRQSIGMVWKDLLNSTLDHFLANASWLVSEFLTSLGHGTSLHSDNLVVIGAMPGAVL